MNPVSIMQGRLLPPFEGRFQAFPALGWEKEFEYAQGLGLYSIEWIFEKPYEDKNPLGEDKSLKQVERVIAETGVQVKSICADYFMTDFLIDATGQPIPDNVEKLVALIARAAQLCINYIILPFVDSSSLDTDAKRSGLCRVLDQVLKVAETHQVELHLETDWEAESLASLFKRYEHAYLKANYDTGNSASLGYDPAKEMDWLSPWLGSVHIKDRVKGGNTMPLGQGDVDFTCCFDAFSQANFSGFYVLQVARDHAGEEQTWTRHNMNIVQNYLSQMEH